MIKNFVVEVLEILQPSEIVEFRLFLNSPYFNRSYNNSALIQLFEILLKAVQNNSIHELEKLQIFQALYPGKQVVGSKVDKLTTELKGLLQIFLVSQRNLSAENEHQFSLELTKEIRFRGLEDRYFQSLEKLKKQAETTHWESINGYHFLHLTAIEEHEWSSTYNKSRGDLNIPSVIEYLDSYYFTLRTEMLNRLLLQQKQVILPLESKKITDAPWVVPIENLQQSAILKISLEVHNLLKEDIPKMEGYYHLLTTIQQLEKSINPETLAQFYTYLRNICVILIDTGQVEFNAVLHEIQKDNLERGYFYFQGKISPHAYINITQVASNVNAIEWAKDFVEKHKSIIIGENETQEFYRMNKAICLFAEKEYDQALEIIPFGTTYSLVHLMARRLELKIYYETHSELLEFKIDAFKMFISRAGQKVLSKSLYELFVNFINILRQLHQSSGIRDKNRSQQLIKRINEKKRLAERSWLLEKARELGGRKV